MDERDDCREAHHLHCPDPPFPHYGLSAGVPKSIIVVVGIPRVLSLDRRATDETKSNQNQRRSGGGRESRGHKRTADETGSALHEQRIRLWTLTQPGPSNELVANLCSLERGAH